MMIALKTLRMRRRPGAILAADVPGYSALSVADEEGMLRALNGHKSALEPLIGLDRGRMFRTMGDGFVAEFPCVVDALSCADTIQNRMADHDAARGDGLEMQFRVDIHVGDIVAEADDAIDSRRRAEDYRFLISPPNEPSFQAQRTAALGPIRRWSLRREPALS